jgi:hypothetical protein
VRSASTGSGVNAAKKRESVERAGNWSRSRPGHERTCKRLEPLVEGLQGVFPAHGVAEEYGEKIEHIIAPEAPPCKTHVLSDLAQNVVRGVDAPPSARLLRTRKGARQHTRKRSGYAPFHRRYWSYVPRFREWS